MVIIARRGICEGNYTKLPNRKKRLLTKEFLEDFRDNLIMLDKERCTKNGYPEIDYSQASYYSFYGQVESSFLFYNALKLTCEKHNVVNGIYNYAKRMPWYDSDLFDYDIVSRMVELNVIPLKTAYDDIVEPIEELNAPYKKITYHKGYNEVVYDTWFSDDKKSLEDIYCDSENVSIVWLDK